MCHVEYGMWHAAYFRTFFIISGSRKNFCCRTLTRFHRGFHAAQGMAGVFAGKMDTPCRL
jgi:hypothetical protein